MTWKLAAAAAGALLQVGLVAALTADHAARRFSISVSAGAAAKDSAVQKGREASAGVPSPSMTISAAAPVGDKALPFAVLFGVVFAYVVQRRLFGAARPPGTRRKLAHCKTNAGQPPGGSKSVFSILAD
jgi:hypothetical protein